MAEAKEEGRMNLEILKSVYGLTDAEFRIAESIMQGEYRLDTLQEKFRISLSTAKHHVTAINRKMGCPGVPKILLVLKIANAVIDDMEDQADLSIVERRKNEPVDIVTAVDELR